MDTLVVRVQTDEPRPARSLEDALLRVGAALPALGVEFRITSGVWRPAPKLSLQWAVRQPVETSCMVAALAMPSGAPVTEDGGVLLFGEVDAAPSAASAAEHVWKVYTEGGVAAVQVLDGCFSALIADARLGAVHVVSDLIGQRALRIAEQDGSFYLSPHDACLVACGAATVEFDATSALSCLVLENSLGARPLLRGVRGLEGNDWVTFLPAARPKFQRVPKLDFSARLPEGDRRAIALCRDDIVAHIVASTRQWAQSGRTLRCELTAGIDSRASLACLLAAGARARVEAITSGGLQSSDFRTAARLAELAGVRHMRLPDASPDTGSFVQNGTLRAFATNGETDCKRSARALPEWQPDGPIRVEGSSSEVYRGYFYQYAGLSGIAPSAPEALAHLMLTRRYRRFSKVPVAEEQIRSELRLRLVRTFEEYAALSSNGNDALDAFYLFERCAHWSAHVKRATWQVSRNPLLVPSAIRLAFKLPPPVGQHSGIHGELIRRYFPASASVWINGARPLFTEGPGWARGALRLALVAAHAGLEVARQRVSAARRTQNATQADLFAGALYPVVHELLTASGSVTRDALGDAGVQRVLDEHRTRKNQLALLGYAVTQELFANLLRRVRSQ